MKDYNPHYQHFSVLSQHLVQFIILLAQIEKDIRSITILAYLSRHVQRNVTLSWINQLIRRENIKRPQGRPSNEYMQREPYYLKKIETCYDYYEHLGVKVMQDAAEGFGIYGLFASLMRSSVNSYLPQKQTTQIKFLKTITAIALTPGVKNFEEALNADIAHTGMSITSARNVIKGIENINKFADIASKLFSVYWIQFLSLDQIQQTLYFDGHVKPYYTKEDHVCGVMSVSGKIMPGTKYVIVTNTQGYILKLDYCRVDQHYNDTIYGQLENLSIMLKKPVDLAIMDREGCGKDFNQRINNDFQIGTLTPLRSNQYKELDDFACEQIDKKLYVGTWKDEKKNRSDPRTFVIIDYEKRQCVFQITTDQFDYREIPNMYKTRWPMNEEIIKNLNMQTDFNVNICNGTFVIPDPKHKAKLETLQEKIKGAQLKINEYTIKSENAKRKSEKSRYERQRENIEQRKEKYTSEKEKLGTCGTKKIRNVEPDYFVSLLKASLLNLFRYFLKQCLPEYENPPMEKFYHLFMNRRGTYYSTQYENIYEFDTPSRKSDKELLGIFCRNYTAMKNKGGNGKWIVLKFKELPP